MWFNGKVIRSSIPSTKRKKKILPGSCVSNVLLTSVSLNKYGKTWHPPEASFAGKKMLLNVLKLLENIQNTWLCGSPASLSKTLPGSFLLSLGMKDLHKSCMQI